MYIYYVDNNSCDYKMRRSFELWIKSWYCPIVKNKQTSKQANKQIKQSKQANNKTMGVMWLKQPGIFLFLHLLHRNFLFLCWCHMSFTGCWLSSSSTSTYDDTMENGMLDECQVYMLIMWVICHCSHPK